jgi:hypothetical protein
MSSRRSLALSAPVFPQSQSIVNSNKKMDVIALHRSLLEKCCASSKVVHTVSFTVITSCQLVRLYSSNQTSEIDLD